MIALTMSKVHLSRGNVENKRIKCKGSKFQPQRKRQGGDLNRDMDESF